jgi:hypothetical protein
LRLLTAKVGADQAFDIGFHQDLQHRLRHGSQEIALAALLQQEGHTTLYPYTRTGFYQFLHDHGSQISPAVGSRRIKVFRAYNQFEVTIIRNDRSFLGRLGNRNRTRPAA